ncbi:hypothetical protein ACFL59_08500 [Planctomycetota bacterium]
MMYVRHFAATWALLAIAAGAVGCARSPGDAGGGPVTAGVSASSSASTSQPTYHGSDPDVPVITITSPTRGELLDRSTNPSGEVVVAGTVIDALSGVASVEVNGRTAPLDSAGGFQLSVPLVKSGNAIVVTATDLAGNEARSVRSVVFAERYEPPSRDIPNSLCARVNEAALDALGSVIVATVQQGGTIYQALLNGGNPIWQDKVSMPLVGCVASVRVTILGVAFDQPTLVFDTHSGEISATFSIPNVRISAVADDDGCGIPWPAVSGDISANRADITLGLAAAIDPQTQRLRLTPTRSTVTLNGFGVTFTNVPGQLLVMLPSAVESQIADAIGSALRGVLPGLLEDEVNAFFQPLTGDWQGRKVTLTLTPDSCDIDEYGLLLVCSSNTTASSAAPHVPSAPGSFFEPAHGVSLPTFPAVSPNLSLGLVSNAWNRVLYATWQSGFWNLRIDQAFVNMVSPGGNTSFNTNIIASYASGIVPPSSPMAIDTELLAQPILLPSPGGPTAAHLVVPELHIKLLVDSGSGFVPIAELAVHLEVDVDLVVQNGHELAVGLSGTPRFEAELMSSTLPLNGPSVLRFLNSLAPSILSIVGRTIGPFPMGSLSARNLVTLNGARIYVDGPAGDYIAVQGDL